MKKPQKTRFMTKQTKSKIITSKNMPITSFLFSVSMLEMPF